jgi:Histidine kinase-like ATPase domain
VSEAATTAYTAAPAGGVSPCDNWRWLRPAAEMAAAVSGVWPLVREPAAFDVRGFPRVATRTPAPGAGSVGAARDFAGATLERWGVEERRDDIVVVVSELLTNALRHTQPTEGLVWHRRPVRLGLLQPGPWVMCAIADPSQQLPAPREPGCYEESGRGLHVVASLSDQWGCTSPSPLGKVVWALFATGSAGWARWPGRRR